MCLASVQPHPLRGTNLVLSLHADTSPADLASPKVLV